MDEIVPIVIFFIIIFAGGIKKLLQILAKQMAPPEGQPRSIEAAPDQIREFLDRMQGVRRPPEAPVQPPQRAQAAEELAPGWEPGEFVPLAVEVEEELPERPALEPAQPQALEPPPVLTRKRARPKKPRKRRPERVAPAPQAKEAPPAAPPGPKGIKEWDLKQAVIWSEILGRPVSRRRRPGHHPPSIVG